MPGTITTIDDESLTTRCCSQWTQPVEVGGDQTWTYDGKNTFFKGPFLSPLLFENESSDARDHCANERTFLSYLRLSIYMAVVSVAITLSFHLKSQPSAIERKMAKPLGAVFWALSVATLFVGLGNYIRTINKYGRREAIVQSGWKTQLTLGILASCIVGTCVILLSISNTSSRDSRLMSFVMQP
ncbi:hypothetical protein NLU13_0457 [Sarocladium strictum]|uniref:DUF202 domain-containing protein n=1 Tax=Sarocladium strictum TaxID=5046 RepID=A0AA39GQZ0_SARSR|nr:hypothetical protein NLU13_0457 [Sarocladium strictum]